MIKANEIRCGNRFIREIHNQRGLEYDHDFVMTETLMGKFFSPDTGWALQDLFPIPLTPEILEKCGFDSAFILELNKDWFIGFHGHTYLQIEKEYKENFNPVCERLLLSGCKHLHQLQNLYFALTGTELEYTP